MNQDQLNAIKARCDIVLHGAWEVSDACIYRILPAAEGEPLVTRHYVKREIVARMLEDVPDLLAEIEMLQGRKPIPNSWWKDCPGLAQVTMERIIEKNDRLRAEKAPDVVASLLKEVERLRGGLTKIVDTEPACGDDGPGTDTYYIMKGIAFKTLEGEPDDEKTKVD